MKVLPPVLQSPSMTNIRRRINKSSLRIRETRMSMQARIILRLQLRNNLIMLKKKKEVI